jgi:peptidyl-prolyl cis-trans isomerase SurA
MPKKPFLSSLAALALVLLLPLAAGAATKVDRIVAQVNRNVITLSDLQARLALLSPAQKAALSAGGESIDATVLNMMIEEELLTQAAAAYSIGVAEAEIDEAIKAIMTENNISEAQLKASLQQGGMTFPAFRIQLRQEILTNKLISMTVVNKMVVTESEVTDFLNGNLPQGVQPTLSESGVSDFDGVRIIYLRCTPQTAQAVMKKAAGIKAEIEGGLPFEDAARKYSEGPGAAEGGNPGNVTVSELQPELQAIAKKLAPNVVSEPLYGGQVVLLVTVIPTRARTQEGGVKAGDYSPEERQAGRRRLEQMKVRAKLESYMEDLKRKAVIKVML